MNVTSKCSCFGRLVLSVWGDCAPTFQMWGAHGGHGGRRGLAKALERGLLSRGVVRCAVLLFLLLLV